ncbi:substrate-binding domain-containing protein [Rubrivivax gelatinosus]|uniref:Monosaccharide ABC transporter substrate-binding protein (CUT2 family) n=1 Tax=Rubrivivax gelatinosus TaxID=28068 RepID=A0A4R2MDE3_RUBGE|nr:substrate-binding domain-containing protein [Rubrivivax gelatinosus]MBK1687132.1 sugar ABC transporter substrate-binding protein [Rubrivivax gelatinosus]TCP00646.1 monosaccharide ABC transporter substrate-binding protein (CUT2 family) [Rubrivivax gelatinosus]
MRLPWRFLIGLLWAAGAQAQGQVYGLAGKSTDDPNYVAAWRGCAAEAQVWGDRCEAIGTPGPARARAQDAAVVAALQRGLAGLAVAVTNSRYLADSALALAAQRGVPVVTFDTDVEGAQRTLRRVHIGADDEEIGRQLASLVIARRPEGGQLCLLAGDSQDPGIAARVTALRRALAQDPKLPEGARLAGERGWREVARCPWFNGDDTRRAVRQLQLAFSEEGADAVVSLGAWPFADPPRYRAAVASLRLQGRSRVVVAATGALSPAQKALLADGQVHGFVSLDYELMGRYAYRAMKRLATGHAVEPSIRIGAVVRQGL